MNSPSQIYCVVRKKWVDRTPEEEVRQHIIKYLNAACDIPLHLMVCEYPIKHLGHRADLVVHNRNGLPFILAEFKAPAVVLNNNVLEQIRRYNETLRAAYLLISNGITTLFWIFNKKTNRYEPMKNIPPFEELLNNTHHE
ncbi:MAG: type I restriction enzyme HsdR N-terminal domain-containing protein [Bacteroidales bacterium]|jgi:hypothetical protein|nr:type I restriction enzyme HsdR N-terminal domain-containing protein [Bacteroidales bacterium]HHV40520.1 type I restriction enzyme HsdR N-terminal domain-containing protein [Bacteroidales bacterium]